MKLPLPGPKYDQAQQQAVHRELGREDNLNRKKGAHIELTAGEFLILKSPDGSRFKLTVSNVGVLSAVAL